MAVYDSYYLYDSSKILSKHALRQGKTCQIEKYAV